MEIFGYTPDHGWMEIGNSGIFRPEMLMPMGLPEVFAESLQWHLVLAAIIAWLLLSQDVRVIAWGFGLER